MNKDYLENWQWPTQRTPPTWNPSTTQSSMIVGGGRDKRGALARQGRAHTARIMYSKTAPNKQGNGSNKQRNGFT